MPKLLSLGGSLLLAALLSASPAHAETTTLQDVERAYADVDFEQTRELAQASLAQGKNDHATTTRLYLLWATSAAALDRVEESRQAFRHVLAADPTLKLDKSLSPKLRAPYLEARGELTLDDGKPPLDVALELRKKELELSLKDPLRVAKHLELWSREGSQGEFTRRRCAPQAQQRIPTPEGQALQFFLRVTDEHANVLVERGTEDSPRHLALVSSDPAAAANGVRDANPTPYHVTAAALGALALASGTASVAYYVERENAAQEWNGAGCEQPGSTRAQQCGDVDERRQRAEMLAIGFGAAGGALLVGSVVTLLLAPAKTKQRPQLGFFAAPGQVQLTLGSSL
jgi:hypothetical protein